MTLIFSNFYRRLPTVTVPYKPTHKLLLLKNERLLAIGLSEKFIREQGLPDWWDSEFEDIPGTSFEAATYISRRLNLDINSLLAPSSME